MSKKAQTIFKSTLILMFALVVGKIIGFYRIRLLAASFDKTVTDSFFAAFNIFDNLYRLTIVGFVFIPIFIEFREKKNKDEWAFVGTVINSILLVYAGLALIFLIFAKPIVQVLYKDFNLDQTLLTVKYIRLMLVQPLIFSLVGIFGGILNSYKRFLANSLFTSIYSIGIILGIIYLVPLIGPEGLAWGVVAGSILGVVIQVPSLIKVGFKYKLKLDVKTQEFKRFVKLALPRVITLFIIQLNFLVISSFASRIQVGGVSMFRYAFNFHDLFVTFLGFSVATAFFPTFSENIVKKDYKSFGVNINRALNSLVFLGIPIAFFLALLARPIISFFLGTGEFTLNQVNDTSLILSFMCLGLVAYIIEPLIIRIYYALRNTMTPLIIAIIAFCFNLCFSFLAIEVFEWGLFSLAISYSVSGIVSIIILGRFVQKKFNFINFEYFSKMVLKTILICLVSLIPAVVILFVFSFSDFLNLFLVTAISGSIFAWLAWKLQIKEFALVFDKVIAFLKRKRISFSFFRSK